MFVVKNETMFLKINSNGGAEKTALYRKATKFSTYAKAKQAIRKAPAKLASYWIENCNNLDEQGNRIENSELIKSKRTPISSNVKYQKYIEQRGLCAYCGQYYEFSAMTNDHIFPLSKGGSNTADNIQCVCFSCNQLKGNQDEQDFLNHINMISRYRIAPLEQSKQELVNKEEKTESISEEYPGFLKELKNLFRKYYTKKTA